MKNYDFVFRSEAECDANIKKIEKAVSKYNPGRCPVCTHKVGIGYNCQFSHNSVVHPEFIISCKNCKIRVGPFDDPDETVKIWNNMTNKQSLCSFTKNTSNDE